MKLTKVIPNIIVYRLNAESNDAEKFKCAWADFTLEFEHRRLSIHSDSGDYSYSWGYSHKDSLLNLLSRVDREYLLDKLSNKTIFNVVKSKESLMEAVMGMTSAYNDDEIRKIIADIKVLPDIMSEESYIHNVERLVRKMDWEDVPVIKEYPYNAEVVVDFFLKYVQPQIRQDFEESKKTIVIRFTGDNEPMARSEIENIITNKLQLMMTDMVTKSSKRACRNAYGKELSPDEFENLDANEAWFDDYDFTFVATIETHMPREMVIEKLQEQGVDCE